MLRPSACWMINGLGWRLPVRIRPTVDVSKADAVFADGVLTLTLPKTEQVKPKTITVKKK